MFRVLVLILVCCSAITQVQPQTALISRNEYSNAYSSALEKSREYSRHQTSKLVKSLNGSVRILLWDWEYELPYKHRLVFEEKTAEKNSRFERISLEYKTFCKADDADWVIETGSCETSLPWVITQQSYMLSTRASSKFTSEQQSINGRKVRSYREYALFGSVSGVGGTGSFSHYNECIFWVDGTGRLIKQSFKSGAVGSNQIYGSWDDEIDYERSVKVEAPNERRVPAKLQM